jgi:hypothetical protein
MLMFSYRLNYIHVTTGVINDPEINKYTNPMLSTYLNISEKGAENIWTQEG